MVCQRGGDEQQLPGWAPGLLSLGPSNVLAGRRQRDRSPGDLGVNAGVAINNTYTLPLRVKRPCQGKTACKLKRVHACMLPALVPQQLPSTRSKPGRNQPLSGRALITEQGETWIRFPCCSPMVGKNAFQSANWKFAERSGGADGVFQVQASLGLKACVLCCW